MTRFQIIYVLYFQKNKQIVTKDNKFAKLIKEPDKFEEKNNLVSNEN